MDNFHIDVTTQGEKGLLYALNLAFLNHPKAKGYAVLPEIGLVFFWSDYEKIEGFMALPFELDADGATDFAERWLKETDYGEEPNHDGSNGKGYRVYTDSWGHVQNANGGLMHSSMCAVQPAYAIHGK